MKRLSFSLHLGDAELVVQCSDGVMLTAYPRLPLTMYLDARQARQLGTMLLLMADDIDAQRAAHESRMAAIATERGATCQHDGN